ncbi:hypothetical protein [Saccharothrix hoggarensis]|uniref:Uncharacterized protein n=1 Tax=Saccharothrix hoggarensis TaxID=913853 RepID=A0ABW3QRH2_9PSEU
MTTPEPNHRGTPPVPAPTSASADQPAVDQQPAAAPWGTEPQPAPWATGPQLAEAHPAQHPYPPHPEFPPNLFQPEMRQPSATRSGGRVPIVVLTALAVVFAVVAGVFTALYASERAELDRTTATRADRERALADVTAQQAEADRTLDTTRSRETTLTAEHDLLTECVDAAKGYFDLPPGPSPESSRLFGVMYDVCPQI